MRAGQPFTCRSDLDLEPVDLVRAMDQAGLTVRKCEQGQRIAEILGTVPTPVHLSNHAATRLQQQRFRAIAIHQGGKVRSRRNSDGLKASERGPTN